MPDLPRPVSDWLVGLVESQRSIAHLLVDDAATLLDSGGDLAAYGLAGTRIGDPACEQLPFLEGLIPIPESPFLLRSLGMPSGRVADVHLIAEATATRIILLDVTTEHDQAQRVQQKAYDMTLLSQREARLIARLEAAHAELTAAHGELARSREELLITHDRLQQELRDAERYVRAIIPSPIEDPFRVEWLYVPCTELGGDSLGYHWLDPDHFAVYLLDVCGHGVGAALLSVAVVNALRSGALPGTDFHAPADVLGSLNRAFQMDDHDDMYFTIWYGVLHWPTGVLRHASAGHPPPVLVRGPRGHVGQPVRLTLSGPAVGIMPTSRYTAEEVCLDTPARLYVFSDGVYEITEPTGDVMDYGDFQDLLANPTGDGRSELDGLLRFAREKRGESVLEDDFSILRLEL